MVQKELRKFSKWFWKGFLKRYDGGGENGITSKRIFEVEVFSPLRILTSPLFEETLGAFFSSSFFFLFFNNFFSLLFFMLRLLRTWGVLMIFEEKNHFFKNFFSNGFNILVVDAYFGMELCMPICLNHDHGDGWVVDISAVDAYPGVEVCTPIFLIRKSFSKNLQNSNGHIP